MDGMFFFLSCSLLTKFSLFKEVCLLEVFVSRPMLQLALICFRQFSLFGLNMLGWIFEGTRNGVEVCLTDLLKILHLQSQDFISAEEAFKTITWYTPTH